MGVQLASIDLLPLSTMDPLLLQEGILPGYSDKL